MFSEPNKSIGDGFSIKRKKLKLIYNLLDFLPLNVDYEKSTDTPETFLKSPLFASKFVTSIPSDSPTQPNSKWGSLTSRVPPGYFWEFTRSNLISYY